MAQESFDLPITVYDAFTTFVSDTFVLALPLKFSGGKLEPLPAVTYPKDTTGNFQTALSRLDAVVNPNTPLYLILCRDDTLIAITYIPHLAPAELKPLYLEGRHTLVKCLGASHFKSTLICKEAAEITDIRSWNERDTIHAPGCETNPEVLSENQEVKDLSHYMNKCRLCDRRMKNTIEENASKALKKMSDSGDCVQLCVDMSSENLRLNFFEQHIPPNGVAARLPADYPSFTFYRHLESHLMYFVFCSPDSVPVKERMTHTMAIPGLVNIIAKGCGVDVDQKIEIHDADDLEFGEKNTRIGKFRSMYLRNEFSGTESTWENMEASQTTLDLIR